MSLAMTDAEIASHYRQAKNKSGDIKIMAELCATTKETIRKALQREGVIPSPEHLEECREAVRFSKLKRRMREEEVRTQ